MVVEYFKWFMQRDSGSMKLSAFRSKRNQIIASRHSQEAISMVENLSDTSRHTERGTSRNFTMAFSSNGKYRIKYELFKAFTKGWLCPSYTCFVLVCSHLQTNL